MAVKKKTDTRGVNMMSRRVETAVDTLSQLPEESKWEVVTRTQAQVE